MKIPKARKLPSGNWFIQMRLGGESISITARTEKDCIRQAEYAKSQYRMGIRSQDEKAAPTLSEAIDSYISKRDAVLSPSTIRGYRIVQHHRFQSVANIPLSSDIDWQAVINAEAKLCSAKTLKNAWGLVSGAIQDATGITVKVKLPQVVVRDLPFLEPEQIAPFIAAVHGRSVEIPALMALSSLRRSEILALTWEDVDLKHDIIHVRGAAVVGETNHLVQKETNKNTTSARPVPIMIPELRAALMAAQDKTGLVYHGNFNHLFDQINVLCERNNLPLVGVHGLRRSFVSLGFHLGIPEELIMQIGGWSDYNTMRRHYKRLAQSDIHRSIDKLTSFFSDKNANENANDARNA